MLPPEMGRAAGPQPRVSPFSPPRRLRLEPRALSRRLAAPARQAEPRSAPPPPKKKKKLKKITVSSDFTTAGLREGVGRPPAGAGRGSKGIFSRR